MPFQIPPFISTARLPGAQPSTLAQQPMRSIDAAAAPGLQAARAGEALIRVAEHARQWSAEQALAQASQVVADTAGELGRRFYDRQAQAPEGAEGFADGFRADALDLINQRVEALPGQAQQFARNRLLGHYSSWVDSAWRYEASARREWQIRTTGRTLDQLTANVRQDPASLDATLADAEAAIAGSGLGPRDRTIMVERTRPALVFEALREIARTDPAAARAALDGPHGQLLDDRQRQAIERSIGGGAARRGIAAAAGEQTANAARVAAEEGARSTVLQQQFRTGAEGMQLLAAGGLTPAWISANRAGISAPDLAVLSQAADSTAPAASDDPQAVAILHDDLDDADPYTFASGAARLVMGGRLTPQTYARMVQRNRAANAELNAAGAATARGLRDRMRPPAGGPMGRIVDHERTVALDELTVWTEAHPNAPAAELEAASDQIYARAQARMWTRIAPTLPTLPGFAAPRETAELADVDAFERRTVQAMDRREISSAEAVRRLRASRQWRAAIGLRPQQGGRNAAG